MPRLLALLPKNGLALPGIRANQMSQIVLGAVGSLEHWRFHVQGPSVLFESPRGWIPGKPATGVGERIVYSLPRADFYFWWSYGESEDTREPINWSDSRPPWRPAAALVELIETETAAANAAEDAKDAELATGLYRSGDGQMATGTVGLDMFVPSAPLTEPTRIAEPEPEVADPDDADDLPRATPKKGQRR
jgi:hypothetical protein